MRKITNILAENQTVFVGLEVSKRTWKLNVRVNRRIIDQVSMPGEYAALKQYFISGYPNCNIKVIYEAGYSGFWLYDRLVADGFGCVVTPPHTVTQEKNSRIKNDTVDARRLAKVLEEEDYKACAVPSVKRRSDRQVSRTLIQVQNDIVRTMNRIRKFLDFHGIETGLPIGRWTAAAYRQVRTLKLEGSLQIGWDVLLQLLHYLQEQKKSLRKHLWALSKEPDYQESVRIFSSVPGIGWFTAIRFALEWGDLSRFTTGKHFSSFLGLVCSEDSSGDMLHRGRITGHGNGTVRNWLVECSWQAIGKDPALRKKFDEVWKHSGNKKKAIVAVARKLSVRLYALFCSKETYQLGVIQ
jgi:transposase